VNGCDVYDAPSRHYLSLYTCRPPGLTQRYTKHTSTTVHHHVPDNSTSTSTFRKDLGYFLWAALKGLFTICRNVGYVWC
jgi:hypothetical protein